MKKTSFVKFIALILTLLLSVPFFTACEEAISGALDVLESALGEYLEEEFPTESTAESNFDFKALEDGSYSIALKSGLSACPEVITIPAEYNGAKISAIEAEGFKGNKVIKKVFMTKNVKVVGEGAFSGCSSLERVQFEKESLIEEIQAEAFLNCALTYVNFPSGLKVIGNKAFYECSLKFITLPETLLTIGEYAFTGNTILTVTIPASVTQIGEGAFSLIYALNSISVDEANANFKAVDGVLYSKDGKTLIQYPIAKNKNSFTVPASVEVIGVKALHNAIMLGEVKFEQGSKLSTIKANAFENCALIVSLELPATVTSIESNAFLNCYKLVEVINRSQEITVEKGAEENGRVGYYALKVYNPANGNVTSGIFTDANGYITITDGESILLLGYTGKNTELVLPNNITHIYEGALNGYLNSYSKSFGIELFPALTSVVIPETVVYIGSKAFSKCETLNGITFKGTVEQWEAIEKGADWKEGVPATKVVCSNGEVTLSK